MSQKKRGFVEVSVKDRLSSRQTTEPPKFNFPLQIGWLYEDGEEFLEKEQIETILQLNREPLIEDLEKVLDDSMLRFDYFKEKADYDAEMYYFPHHAILLLCELKAEKSLSSIFELLQQSEDFIDTWFWDIMPQFTGTALFHLGENNTEEIIDFLKAPKVSGSHKADVIENFQFLIEKYPEKREEYVATFDELMDFYLKNAENPDLADTTTYSFLISIAAEAGFKELLPKIEQLFETELINPGVGGDYDSIAEIIEQQDLMLIGKEFIQADIFRKHQMYIKNLEAFEAEVEDEMGFLEDDDDYYPIEEDESRELNPDDYEHAISDESDYFAPQDPVKKDKKVGRNNPCPCGSGKKYKKCCLKK